MTMKYAFNSQAALEVTITRDLAGYTWRCGDKTVGGYPSRDAAMVDAVRALNSPCSFKIMEG